MPNTYGNFSAKSVTETRVVATANAWTALPTTAMGGRALVEVYNKDSKKLYFSFDNSAGVKERYAIDGGEFKAFPIQDNVTLYGRGDPNAGSCRVIVTEYK